MENNEPIQPVKQSLFKLHANLALLGIAVAVIAGTCLFFISTEQFRTKATPQASGGDQQSSNGAGEETSNPSESKVPYYKTAPGLANVTNKQDFYMSDEAAVLLEKNSFVVIPSWHKEFFQLYESNRYGYIPNFVTTDAVLHNYHLVFNYVLKELEENQLYETHKRLNASMLAKSIEQYNALKGTEWENAAKRTVGFFAVGSKLLDSSVNVPDPTITNFLSVSIWRYALIKKWTPL